MIHRWRFEFSDGNPGRFFVSKYSTLCSNHGKIDWTIQIIPDRVEKNGHVPVLKKSRS
jgi:hypothetical protein